MLFPLLGLLLFCALLTPFAIAYLALEPQARSPSSVLRFYLGSGLWPFLVSAVFEVLELQNIWLNQNLGFLAFLAPFGGVMIDWVWRQFLRGEAGSKRFFPALLTSLMMISGAFFHFLYLGSIDNNPTYSDRSLQGAWRGREGELVLADGGNWSRDGDWGIIVNAKRYRVIRSFGQLCLTEDFDPDGATILYRKLPDR